MNTAIYVRVSTTDQRADSQIQELTDYCRLRRWESPITYSDQESGAKVSRPELDRLLGDIRAGKVERVVCYKLDRLGRSLTHLALLLDEFARHRIPLICTSQGIDTSDDNPAGRLQLGVLMSVAQFERSLTRERVNAGLRAAKSRGVRLGRPGTLAGRRKDVMRLKEGGMGLRAIARDLRMPVSSVAKVLQMAA